MLAPSSDLLRAGLGLKINQVKRATRSYLRDRTDHVTSTATSFAVAAGLYAASGIFLIAAILVGVVALFRWIEINYGRFEAFGVVGGLLLVIAIICAALAASRLRRPARHFPSFTSRLRVAVTASPVKSGQIEVAKDTAAASALARSAPSPRKTNPPPVPAKSDLRAGLILTTVLLGWAVARRIRQARRTEA